MLLISFTMLFNGGLIPTYIVISSLGLVNSRWVMILPTAINVFNMIVLRTSFMEIPDSLEEAAKLEGAGDLYYLFRIVVPLSKATIAVIVLFIAVTQWNSWFQAAIFLNKRELYPLQLILREILIAGNANLTNASADVASSYSLYTMLIQFSTIIVSTVPILCIYPFLQKYFTKGVMIGAIKG
jgi:putative aldouronate transport system permease protein